MLAPPVFPFFLLSVVSTNCFPALAVAWDETATADFPVDDKEPTVDFPSATTEVSSLADETVAFEATRLSSNVEKSLFPLNPREGTTEASGKKQPRRIVRPASIASGCFTVFLFLAILMRRYAGAFEAAEQVLPDEEEERVASEPVAEAIPGKTPVSSRDRRLVRAARTVADEAQMARTGDLMALQHHAAALEASVGSAESKATLQQLHSAAKRTAEAKELARKAQMRVLESFDETDKKRAAVEAEEAVKQLQRHRGEMVKSSRLLLQQALAALGTRRKNAAAVVQRIEKHATSIQQLFDGFQEVILEGNINGEHLKPHLKLLQGLQQQAKEQFDKLDSAWLNIVTVSSHAASRTSPSLYDLSADLEAAAKAARKVEGTHQALKAMGSTADAWEEGGNKATRNTVAMVSAALRMWAADSLARSETSVARIRGANITLPMEKEKERIKLLAVAEILEKKLKDLLVERLQPDAPLLIALRNARHDDSVYRQIMRAGKEAEKTLDGIYGKSLPNLNKLDAERQQELRQMLLLSARVTAEIYQRALASLSLVPYEELKGAAAKETWDRMSSEYSEAQQAIGEAWQALKEAEASLDLVLLQRKAQKAREIAILGMLAAVGAVVRDAEIRCWLQLEKDIKLIHSLTQGQGKEEGIAADLLVLRSEENLPSALSFIGKTLERELQSREAAMEALAKKKI